MTKLESMLEQMPADQLRKIEAFAARLFMTKGSAAANRPTSGRPNNIRLDELDGLLVRVTDDLSDEEADRRVRNAWADAAED